MEMWQYWAIAGALLVILEMLTPTMFFLNLALASFAVAGIAFYTQNLYILIPTWVVLSGIFVLFLRPFFNKANNNNQNVGNMDRYINQKASVIEDVDKNGGVIKIYGERWEARTSEDKKIPAGANVIIESNDNLIMFVKKER